MKPKIILRISAALMFIHAIGHTFGHAGWKKSPDPQKMEIIHQMTDHKFPFMGEPRSMGEYFDGYGYIVSVFILLIGVLLLSVSRRYPDDDCRFQDQKPLI
jgi:hypothetical protein